MNERSTGKFPLKIQNKAKDFSTENYSLSFTNVRSVRRQKFNLLAASIPMKDFKH